MIPPLILGKSFIKIIGFLLKKTCHKPKTTRQAKNFAPCPKLEKARTKQIS